MSNCEDLKLGKCCLIEAGDRCGCQCYRANTRDETLCDVCWHDIGFHEREVEHKTATPSLLNQVLSGQALEEEAIASELNQTFSRRNFANSSFKPKRNNQESYRTFDPAAATNFSLTQSISGRNRRVEVIKEMLIQTILLPDVGKSLRSPMSSQAKFQEMYDAGYIKDIVFKETDNIVQKIEETFPILSGKEWVLRRSSIKGFTKEFETNQLGISYSIIKRLLINKNKLYISPKDEPLPLPSTTPIGTLTNPINLLDNQTTLSIPSTTFIDSYNVSISSTNNNHTQSSRSSLTSNSTIGSDGSSTNLLAESSVSLNLSLDSTNNFIQEILIQLQLDYKVSGMTILTINNTIDVVDEILEWVEKIDDVELLKKPIISVITERVVDAGGVFMHVTQQFWDQLKIYENTFFQSYDDLYIISPSPILLNSKKLVLLGKILFWCLMHSGAWPHWIHKFHFQYMFDMNIDYILILKEINPQVYEIIKSIRNIEELKPGKIPSLQEWGMAYNLQEIDLLALASGNKENLVDFIAKHEILNIRKSHLKDLKDGFNIFKILKIIKENIHNITWINFENKLYQVVISKDDLLDQFDHTTNLKRIEGNLKREILYSKFLDFLRNLKLPIERQNILRFICGKIAIPLPSNQKIQVQWKNKGDKNQPLLRIPNSKTCLKTVWLSENYEVTDEDEMNVFDRDLKEAMILNTNTGFND